MTRLGHLCLAVVFASAAAFGVESCRKPPVPPPNNPGGAGGSDVSGTGGAPAPSCGAAAAHADQVCPGAGEVVMAICRNMPTSYLLGVMAASDCDGVSHGDPVNPNPSGRPIQHGR